MRRAYFLSIVGVSVVAVSACELYLGGHVTSQQNLGPADAGYQPDGSSPQWPDALGGHDGPDGHDGHDGGGVTTHADAGSHVPDAVTYVPDAGTYVPDAGSYVPDAGTYVPDAGSYVPDAGSYVPDAGTYVPDAGSYPKRGRAHH